MTKVVLPKTNQVGANEWNDVEANDAALAETINGQLDNENLKSGAAIDAGKLASNAKPVTWYTPKVIATEESRTNTAFGTLTTPDEITGVVMPENGLMMIGFMAIVKNSVSGAGNVALYLNSTELKGAAATAPEIVQCQLRNGTEFTTVSTTPIGLTGNAGGTSFVTTGQVIRARELSEAGSMNGGVLYAFAAAGTYAVSVRYKSTSGSVTAKERKLWVATLGY